MRERGREIQQRMMKITVISESRGALLRVLDGLKMIRELNGLKVLKLEGTGCVSIPLALCIVDMIL